MDAQLLVCVRLTRNNFLFEDYTPEDHILMLVASGSFLLETEGFRQTVRAGEAAWFHPGVRYHRVITEPAELFLFRFLADDALYPGHHIPFRDSQRISSTVRLLRQLDDRPLPQDFQLRSALFQDLLTQLTIESGQALFDRPSDPMITDAVGRMNQFLHQRKALPGLAKVYGLSYVQFCRRFKSAMGTTPTGYLLQLRLRKAKTMLLETELPIYRIASECGFDNEYYFSNFFKKHTGTTPSAFRKQGI